MTQKGKVIYRDGEDGPIRTIKYTDLEDNGEFLKITRLLDGMEIELRKSLILKIEHHKPQSTEDNNEGKNDR
jgi:hypothetical protein